MVNAAVNSAREAERALAISYAPADARAALTTLFALDRRLGELVAARREPIVAQMRLTWWHEALTALDRQPPPAEPLLQAVARDLLPRGIAGAELAAMIDGWERLLDEPVDLSAYARERGGVLFELAARAAGDGVAPVAEAGGGWALADLARRGGDGELKGMAEATARASLARALRSRWPRPVRTLGALALLARSDLSGGTPGAPARVARIAWHRLTGR